MKAKNLHLKGDINKLAFFLIVGLWGKKRKMQLFFLEIVVNQENRSLSAEAKEVIECAASGHVIWLPSQKEAQTLKLITFFVPSQSSQALHALVYHFLRLFGCAGLALVRESHLSISTQCLFHFILHASFPQAMSSAKAYDQKHLVIFSE